MLVFITKASDDYWYEFKEINTIEDILKIDPHTIIEENNFTSELVPYWKGFEEKDIPLLEKAKIHITIYDSYIE